MNPRHVTPAAVTQLIDDLLWAYFSSQVRSFDIMDAVAEMLEEHKDDPRTYSDGTVILKRHDLADPSRAAELAKPPHRRASPKNDSGGEKNPADGTTQTGPAEADRWNHQ